MVQAEDVLTFWLDEVGEAGWYKADDAVDEAIRQRFGCAWQEAREGAFGLWLMSPRETLAYLILTDQFPRNMFRGTPEAFATDASSLQVAMGAIDKDWDLQVTEPERQFFYMPFMHSEDPDDQDRGVALFEARMNTGNNGRHARAHRVIIRQFGRFPYRNDALGRETTAAEAAWIADVGYAGALRMADQDSSD